MSFFAFVPGQPGAVEYDLQDTFAFGCEMCGACCNALDRVVPLSGPDVARVAGYLGLSGRDFLDRCTVTLTDPSDGIPQVVLRPEAGGCSCVLQRGGKCLVHPAKPRACALYPIARGVAPETTGYGAPPRAVVRYTADTHAFLCGNDRRTFTVEQWLRESGVPAEDTAHLEWCALLAARTEEVRRNPKGADAAQLFRELYLCGRW